MELSKNVDKGEALKRNRYRLHDGDLLRHLMAHPPKGKPFTVRGLADEAGVSPSKIQGLRSGGRSTMTGEEVLRITEALHTSPRALFHPVSMSMDMDADPITQQRSPGAPQP